MALTSHQAFFSLTPGSIFVVDSTTCLRPKLLALSSRLLRPQSLSGTVRTQLRGWWNAPRSVPIVDFRSSARKTPPFSPGARLLRNNCSTSLLAKIWWPLLDRPAVASLPWFRRDSFPCCGASSRRRTHGTLSASHLAV